MAEEDGHFPEFKQLYKKVKKKVFSFPLSPMAYSVWSFVLGLAFLF